MWHAWERGEKCTRFWWENPTEKYYLEEHGVDGRLGSEAGQGLMAGFGECGGKPSGSGATELVKFADQANTPCSSLTSPLMRGNQNWR
jgi:hypothetical protein